MGPRKEPAPWWRPDMIGQAAALMIGSTDWISSRARERNSGLRGPTTDDRVGKIILSLDGPVGLHESSARRWDLPCRDLGAPGTTGN